jgi:hypothetical protein
MAINPASVEFKTHYLLKTTLLQKNAGAGILEDVTASL